MKIIKPIFIAASILFSYQASFADENKFEAGEKLFKTNCSACHGATGGMDMSKRIAPPIAAVRMHYIDTYPDEASFVEAVSNWVEKQDSNRSLMPGAIQRFKIMPPLVVAKEDAKKIAAYIYAGNIDKPKGFEQHVNEQHKQQGKMHSQKKGLQGKKIQGQGMPMMQGKGMGMNHQGQGMHKMMQAKQQRQQRMANMPRRGGGSMSAKMMQRLNLSPQQRQQMQSLIQEKESRMKPVKERIHQINQNIRQLDTTSPEYKSQIFSLADEKSKLVFRMVVEKGEMRMKIESVLSPQQRTKLKQLKQMRRNKQPSH